MGNFYDDKIIDTESENLNNATTCAMRWLNRQRKLHISRSFFLMLHKEILAHIPNKAGRYRTATDSINVNSATFKPSSSWSVEITINDLRYIINNRRKWPSIFKKCFVNKFPESTIKSWKRRDRDLFYKIFISWYFHHKFVVIHPFTDGNGRMARLLMCIILKEVKLSYLSFPPLVNYLIKEKKSEYLDCLNAADKEDYLEGTLYMLKILSESYKQTIEAEKTIKKMTSEQEL